MSAWKFEPGDFKTVFSPPMGDDDLEFIAKCANAKLAEWLKHSDLVATLVSYALGEQGYEYETEDARDALAKLGLWPPVERT
jgi:hypothetical protein